MTRTIRPATSNPVVGTAHPNFPALVYMDMDVELGSFSGYVPHDVVPLVEAAPDLLDGCNALLGLLQLIEGRCDAELLEIIRTNHRVGEARAAVAKAMRVTPSMAQFVEAASA